MINQPNSTYSSTLIQDWNAVRAQFNLTSDYLHLGASQFIASHPQPVREAIAHYRRLLDENPVLCTQELENAEMQKVRQAAARYLRLEEPDNIAMTDSTTMGLGTIYSGLNLQPGQEVLTTVHDHYSQHEAIRLATRRSGGSYRKIALYKRVNHVTTDEMVDNLLREVRPNTRVVGITWVHSSTGLKTPVTQIAQALAELNRHRDEADRVLLLVDGVHGFGIEQETFPDLGCDFFIAGCHKWLYGPRGTGLVAATRAAWQTVSPVIPTFTDAMDIITEEAERPDHVDGKQMTPGGFHSLEYRWALRAAFEFMESLGREQVCQRVHALNRQCKEGLAAMPHVTLHTPLADELSAGITSFEVRGYNTDEVVEQLKTRKIIATKAPYQDFQYARFTPGIINTEQEIDRALAAVHALA
ncbi:aminotransferase class V-fold PLP-dependent enzyme [Hymenobacter chitinivorans]|uniref:Selenocysteine lyase/cysteine desulfurase n=1 Tax=Hymenobacter chitinivorans DSM 11115 TaxID=1121954 RepID=A0A2M9BLE4_9BACT|nr:aminotransferase class V-fold PLP-dependent enzyme [Hymenobacter chitinivorans]PJJ58740.1 selenocysteine lyase/cysteine desulfurase [Hymenobacter chitinivorans DSM 11115]